MAKSDLSLDILYKTIIKSHPAIKKEGLGINGFKLLKQNGKKTVIEETKGWRITDITPMSENSIIIRFLAAFYYKQSMSDTIPYYQLFSHKKESLISSNLYLNDLLAINIYDDGAEFFTNSPLDFSYTVNNPSDSLLLKNWISNKTRLPNYQWLTNNERYFKDIDTALYGNEIVEIEDMNEERIRFL